MQTAATGRPRARTNGPSTVPDDERPPMVVAFEWVARITTVALEMVLPGLAGSWLDGKFGTGFIALVGFALGITVGIWHLLVMTKSTGGDDQGKSAK